MGRTKYRTFISDAERRDELFHFLNYLEGRIGRFDERSFLCLSISVIYAVGCYAYISQNKDLVASMDKSEFVILFIYLILPLMSLVAIEYKLWCLKSNYLNMRRLAIADPDNLLDLRMDIRRFEKREKRLKAKKTALRLRDDVLLWGNVMLTILLVISLLNVIMIHIESKAENNYKPVDSPQSILMEKPVMLSYEIDTAFWPGPSNGTAITKLPDKKRIG